jgi:hypothetical protein
MTTCANIECDNYCLDIGAKAKSCPLCGGKKYIAEIFANAVTCVNGECEQYGLELKPNLEVCSVCGMKTKKLALKFRPDLTIPSFILTSAVTLVFVSLYLTYFALPGGNRAIEGFLITEVSFWTQIVTFAVCIILAAVSKNKWAVILAVAAFLAVTFGFGFLVEHGSW